MREYPRLGPTGHLLVTACEKSMRAFLKRYTPGNTCDQITQPNGS